MSSHSFLDGGHDLVHWVAAAALVIGGAVILSIAARSRAMRPRATAELRASGHSGGPAAGRAALAILAGLSACAGVIHLAAAPGHFADLGDVAAGFLAAGVFQLAWAAKVSGSRGRPMSRRIRVTGLGGNLAIIATWAVARTVGVPPGHIDPIALPDAAATVFEGLIVLGIALAATPRLIGRLGRVWPMSSLVSVAVVPVVGLAIVVTSLATLAIAVGADHGLPSGGPAHALVDHR